MYQFTRFEDLSPDDEVCRYVESVLSEKFSDEILSNMTDFVNKVALKINMRGVNVEIVFISYMCYDNLGYSLVCDRMIEKGISIPYVGFIRETIEWLKGVDKVTHWYKLFANRKSYSLEEFYYDVAFYMVVVSKAVESTSKNYGIVAYETDSEEETLL